MLFQYSRKHVKEGQIGDNCSEFAKIERNHHKEKGRIAQHGGAKFENFQKDRGRTGR